MKIAVVIGHEPEAPGAFSQYLGKTEYDYNTEVAKHLPSEIDVYTRPKGGGYKSKMKALAEKMYAGNYNLVLSLHFNAFNNLANGTEALIYRKNERSRRFAELYCRNITKTYGTKDRGVKELSVPSDRGYWFVFFQEGDAIILEPFFGDNEEAKRFADPAKLACVIETTINDYISSL